MVNFTNRGRITALFVASFLPSALRAAPQAYDASSTRKSYPGRTWEAVSTPETVGYRSAALSALRTRLTSLPTTSMMVVVGGRVLFEYGNVSQVSYLASVRKSILSMLYGPYVERGIIDLDRTLGDLNVDDVGGLSPKERSARIRDLLTARSGVYHQASSPGSARNPPSRGSQDPGTYFYYNNWDFNVLGAIFEQLAGRSVFEAFASDLAAPLQLQDFHRERQRMLGDTTRSRYLAYHFFLSARDIARLGLLMVRHGDWNGKPVIPSAWVSRSTSLQVPSVGYGYLWWIPERKGEEWTDAFLAAGSYGQYILGLPALDMVIVHRRSVTDEFAVQRNSFAESSFQPTGVSEGQFLDLVQIILAGRCDTSCR